jgi:hypothetical protein
MAKKQKTVQVEEPMVQEVIIEPTKEQLKELNVKETPLQAPKNTWEIKDRTYFLIRNKRPLSYMLKSTGIFYFDEEAGYERELKYCQNQKTSFVDEMKGDQRLDHIIFRNGVLHVEKEKTILQKLLSLYHPHKGTVYLEHQPIKEAVDQMEVLEMEADALLAARNMDIDMAEAIMRVENGSKVSGMSSKELKRDLLIFAKKNPKLFLDLADDENVILRNFGIKATEMGILTLSSDQRIFSWGSNNRKLMNVPFDEHPYSALAAWFKTDEGMEIYSNIEKRLND